MQLLALLLRDAVAIQHNRRDMIRDQRKSHLVTEFENMVVHQGANKGTAKPFAEFSIFFDFPDVGYRSQELHDIGSFSQFIGRHLGFDTDAGL